MPYGSCRPPFVNLLEQDFGENPWSKTLGGHLTQDFMGTEEARHRGEQDLSHPPGSSLGRTLGARLRGETLRARLRGEHLKKDFGGTFWRKISGGNPHGARLRGNTCSKTSRETFGAKLRSNPWSKASGESFIEQDFGGTLEARLGGKPLEQDFGGRPWSKTSRQNLCEKS